MKEQLLKHAPIAAAALASAVAVRLMMPTVQKLEMPPPSMHAAASSPRTPEIKTRLVSCGDSRRAALSGNDEKGAIALGDGARGRCTLLFAQGWPVAPSCTIEGGKVVRATQDEIEIATELTSVTYHCEAR